MCARWHCWLKWAQSFSLDEAWTASLPPVIQRGTIILHSADTLPFCFNGSALCSLRYSNVKLDRNSKFQRDLIISPPWWNVRLIHVLRAHFQLTKLKQDVATRRFANWNPTNRSAEVNRCFLSGTGKQVSKTLAGEYKTTGIITHTAVAVRAHTGLWSRGLWMCMH